MAPIGAIGLSISTAASVWYGYIKHQQSQSQKGQHAAEQQDAQKEAEKQNTKQEENV